MKETKTNKSGIELIAEERQRQIEVEGWTKEQIEWLHQYDDGNFME